jgi:hypothetical protein
MLAIVRDEIDDRNHIYEDIGVVLDDRNHIYEDIGVVLDLSEF